MVSVNEPGKIILKLQYESNFVMDLQILGHPFLLDIFMASFCSVLVSFFLSHHVQEDPMKGSKQKASNRNEVRGKRDSGTTIKTTNRIYETSVKSLGT